MKDVSILQAYDHGKYEIEASPFCKEDKLTIGEDVYGFGYKSNFIRVLLGLYKVYISIKWGPC